MDDSWVRPRRACQAVRAHVTSIHLAHAQWTCRRLVTWLQCLPTFSYCTLPSGQTGRGKPRVLLARGCPPKLSPSPRPYAVTPSPCASGRHLLNLVQTVLQLWAGKTLLGSFCKCSIGGHLPCASRAPVCKLLLTWRHAIASHSVQVRAGESAARAFEDQSLSRRTAPRPFGTPPWTQLQATPPARKDLTARNLRTLRPAILQHPNHKPLNPLRTSTSEHTLFTPPPSSQLGPASYPPHTRPCPAPPHAPFPPFSRLSHALPLPLLRSATPAAPQERRKVLPAQPRAAGPGAASPAQVVARALLGSHLAQVGAVRGHLRVQGKRAY